MLTVPPHEPMPQRPVIRPSYRQWLAFKGVVSHAMLRPDKTDTHPGFPYDRLAYALGCPWPAAAL